MTQVPRRISENPQPQKNGVKICQQPSIKQRNTLRKLVDCSEIRRSPVDRWWNRLFMTGFIHPTWVFGISEPSTVTSMLNFKGKLKSSKRVCRTSKPFAKSWFWIYTRSTTVNNPSTRSNFWYSFGSFSQVWLGIWIRWIFRTWADPFFQIDFLLFFIFQGGIPDALRKRKPLINSTFQEVYYVFLHCAIKENPNCKVNLFLCLTNIRDFQVSQRNSRRSSRMKI